MEAPRKQGRTENLMLFAGCVALVGISAAMWAKWNSDQPAETKPEIAAIEPVDNPVEEKQPPAKQPAEAKIAEKPAAPKAVEPKPVDRKPKILPTPKPAPVVKSLPVSWPVVDRANRQSKWPAPTITDGNLADWVKFIQPSDDDLKWRKIRWHKSLSVAADEARRLQRPILLWTMNGHPCGET